jgi:hypothetical protein
MVLKRVVMNDAPKCVNMDLSTYKTDTPVKLAAWRMVPTT